MLKQNSMLSYLQMTLIKLPGKLFKLFVTIHCYSREVNWNLLYAVIILLSLNSLSHIAMLFLIVFAIELRYMDPRVA